MSEGRRRGGAGWREESWASVMARWRRRNAGVTLSRWELMRRRRERGRRRGKEGESVGCSAGAITFLGGLQVSLGTAKW